MIASGKKLLLTPGIAFEVRTGAEFLQERLCRPVSADSEGDQSEVSRRFAEWRMRLGVSSDRDLAAYLVEGGTSIEQAKVVLGSITQDPSSYSPGWLRVLFSASVADADTREEPSVPVRLNHSPFAPVLAPFVAVALERVRALAGPSRRLLAPDAHDDLELSLWRRLDACSSKFFTDLYQVAVPEARRTAGADGLESFVSALRGGALADVFTEYPALARQIGCTVEGWAAATVELIARVAVDLDELVKRFGAAEDLPVVARIEPDLSCVHTGQRTVCRLHFSGGATVIYKPRSAVEERLFARVIYALQVHGVDSLRLPRLLDRGAYHWAEDINAEPCVSAVGQERLFRRIGVLIAIVASLGGHGGTRDDLVACREHIVPVDALGLRTQVGPAALTDIQSENELAEEYLVSAVGMAPRWSLSNEGQQREEAGLSVVGHPVLSGPWIEALCGGYADTRTAVLSSPTVRSAIVTLQKRGVPFRLRGKRVYQRLVAELRVASLLHSGLDAGLHVECLAARSPVRAPLAIVRAEQSALLVGEVPVAAFVPWRWKRTQAGEGQGLGSEVSTVDRTKDGVSWLRSLFQCYCPPAAERRVRVGALQSGAPPLSPAQMVAEAAAIAEFLRAGQIEISTGVAWLCLRPVEDADHWRFHPMDGSLFDGCGGLGLLFAALERLLPGRGYRDLALSTLDSGRQRLAATIARSQMGAGIGLTSWLYALACCAILLHQRPLLDESVREAGRVTVDDALASGSYDLLGGVAGVLLVLLRLYQATRASGLLSTARELGTVLVDRRQELPGGGGAWPSSFGEMTTGLAHGSAGIAFALRTLYATTGDVRFNEASDSACRFEDHLFSLPDSAWRVSASRPAITSSWCKGTPGILLSRLAQRELSRESTSSAGLDAPINAMVRATALVDHLCCGNAGRAEVLFEAGRVLGRPDYISVAFTILSSVVRTAKMRGDYSLGMPEIRLQPWLFQGHAGIAWALAHIAAPDRLPSILTFQLPTNEPG